MTPTSCAIAWLDVPWFDEMRYGENSAEHDADSSDNDIGDPKERIPTADDGACRYNYGFGTAVNGYWKVYRLISIAYHLGAENTNCL